MSTTLIDGIAKALAILDALDVVPGSLKVTREVFEQLKRECHYPCTDRRPNSFMGVKIVVKD